jgi:hypothetical protein
MLRAIIIGLIVAILFSLIICLYFWVESRNMAYNWDCLACNQRKKHQEHDSLMEN